MSTYWHDLAKKLERDYLTLNAEKKAFEMSCALAIEARDKAISENARLRAELAAERERTRQALVPLCIGRRTIGLIAEHGMWQSEDGRAVVAADELFRADPYEAIAKLRGVLEQVLIGGNHLALLIGADHPPHTATHYDALAHYKTSQGTYEIWCCWSTMMYARAALEEIGGGE